MGLVKVSNKDGRIVFHVGKELPEAGSDFLLVPGKQNAQGRGVYATEGFPQLKYAGGEHYQKEVERAPIFLLPAQGAWARGVLKMKNNMVVYHTNGKLLLMHDIRFVDSEHEGKPVRYYFSTNIEMIQEPPEQDREGSLLERLRHGKIQQEEVLRMLGQMPLKRERMNPELICQKLKEAVNQNSIPERILELLPPIEHRQEIHPFSLR